MSLLLVIFFGKTSKEILKTLSFPSDFENLSTDKLNSILENIRAKSFAKRKISQLSDKAKSSFGISMYLDSFSLQIKLLIEQISFIEQQVQSIENEIGSIMSKNELSYYYNPGIGIVTGAVIPW